MVPHVNSGKLFILTPIFLVLHFVSFKAQFYGSKFPFPSLEWIEEVKQKILEEWIIKFIIPERPGKKWWRYSRTLHASVVMSTGFLNLHYEQ